jgi:hypothetical protein
MVEFAVHPGTVLLTRIATEGNRNGDRPPSGSAFVQVLSGRNRISRFAPFAPSGPTEPLTGGPISYASTPRSQLIMAAENRGNAGVHPSTWQTLFELIGPIFPFNDAVPAWPLFGTILRSRIRYATA